jgi:hypothetical protein
MKVEVIHILGERELGTTASPEPEEVQSAIQEWLDENNNASIEHVAVLCPGSHFWTKGALVMIFYRD